MSSMNREDFQIFENYKNNPVGDSAESETGCDLVYFDNASTSQTPNQVVNKLVEFYTKHKSNIDRGLYKIEEKSTLLYEESRKVVAKFLNVGDDEIIFTSGATDSSNKLMGILENNFKEKSENKSEILLLKETHNAEYIPVFNFAKNNNKTIKILDNIDELIVNISENTLLVSISLVSNVTGEIFDITNLSKICNEKNITLILDVTSAAGHMKLDLSELGCDAAYFSAHKMCGPSGVGVLFIKRKYTRNINPSFVGGGIVSKVSEGEINYRSDIKLFEAGTQNIPGVIAFAEAIKYLKNIGLESIYNHNQELLRYFYEKLEQEKIGEKDNEKDFKNYLEIYSENDITKNIGIISFNLKNKVGEIIHAHDAAQILANSHICVRSGKHCADIFMNRNNINSSVRVSFYLYNTKEEIDYFFEVVKEIIKKFS